jgi:hypothetical protein
MYDEELIVISWQTANAILKYHGDVPLEKVALLRERVRHSLP